MTVTELSRRLLFPGSIGFLLLGLLVGVVALYGRTRIARLGRIWVTVLTVGYLAISTPFGADLLVWGLSRGFSPITSPAEARHATAIVVLASNSDIHAAHGRQIEHISRTSALRVFEAARLYDMLPGSLVFTSGGPSGYGPETRSLAELLGEELVLLGIPRDRIVIEARSGNTHQHAIRIEPILRKHGVDRFVLVTSPTHIRRATRTFEARGLHPVPSPGTMRSTETATSGNWWPAAQHLQVSQQAIYDYVGLAYYWSQGWI